MPGESNDRRVMIAILLTSTLLTMLGITGILSGTFELQGAPFPEHLEDFNLDGEDEDARIAFGLREATATNPYRRPMAAANIVVSALVLIGSFMLSWRRRISQWWIRQAVLAKVLWLFASTATLVSHVRSVFPTLPSLAGSGVSVGEITFGIVSVSVGTLLLHALAAWRASRSDIETFIDASRPSS